MLSVLKNIKLEKFSKIITYSYKNIGSSYILFKSNFSNKKNYPNKNLKYALFLASGYLFYKTLYQDAFPSVKAATPIALLKDRRRNHNFIADVVETSAPTVVYIEIKDNRRVDFFTGRPATVSNGSGFIIEKDGLIITNAHVVANKPNSKVEVRLFDGTVYNGNVEDIDVQSDLATIRIKAKNLPTMKLGDSSDLRPGEFVVAIGSPLALSNTVTAGVVSSTHRGSDELGLRGKDMVYIQTDAAITFGNSGGPLVNLDGEAIGVNSMKVTAGISFAIPIDHVKQFLKNSSGIKREPSTGAKRKYIGITMLTLTPQIVSELQARNSQLPIGVTSGVLVWKVIYGSPAHSKVDSDYSGYLGTLGLQENQPESLAGIEPGDVVVAINNAAVKCANNVFDALAKPNVRSLLMTIVRYGQKLDIRVCPEDVEVY